MIKKNKPNLMGYFPGENKILFEKSFKKNHTKIQMTFKTQKENYSNIFGMSCYSLSTLLFQVFFVRKVFE